MSVRTLLQAFHAFSGAAPGAQAGPRRGLRLAGRHAIRPWEAAAAASAQRVAFRFGLTGLRWGRQGPAVLVMHGAGGRPTEFRWFLEPLIASGRQVIALDGPAPGGTLRADATAGEFAAAIAEAAVEIPELDTVMGHGSGAAAAILALGQGLPAQRAVLIAAPAVATLAGGPVDLVALARSLRGAALVVHDADDRTVPFAEGDALARAWPGARLLATHGLDHAGVLTDAAVTQGVAEFLAGHDAGLTAGQLRALGAMH